jgi:(p)ppGpp synthase/HD superfamily hydrolase
MQDSFIHSSLPFFGCLTQVSEFAKAGHESINQRRKYSGEPYHTHVFRVADKVQTHGFCPAVIAAALMHDLIEDVNVYPYNEEGIKEKFGERVCNLVLELTDEFTSANYPNINRAGRKKLEADRLSKISFSAKAIKLADLIDNTQDIVANDPGFARKYLQEKEEILHLMVRSGDVFRPLYDEALANLEAGKKLLEMNQQ